MSQQRLNPFRALELRRSGLTWPAVARQLSIEAGRNPGFQPQSVQTAVIKVFGTCKVERKRRVA